MSKPELIKKSGWAFILAGFGFVTILTGSDPIAFPGSVISSILLAVGMSGLRACNSERVGSLGRNILKASVRGIILFYLFLTLLVLAVLFLPGFKSQAESLARSGLWLLMFGGPAVGLLGLTLFGLTTLHNKPMPRLNWLSVFAGIWYPAFYFFLAAYLFAHDGEYPAQHHTTFQIIFLIQFLALCALGAVLNDLSSEMATA